MKKWIVGAPKVIIRYSREQKIRNGREFSVKKKTSTE
jgi:hypothetical protein